mmetsp:Transcript_11487/g.36048  ORF Transcript_11487/g.36048 Transcript_11487/m.36048 type:complete len:207 (-) Transcript_11487:3-623(-)
MKGPSAAPRPAMELVLAISSASFWPAPKVSTKAAFIGAMKEKIIAPEIIRSMNITHMVRGNAATIMRRKVLTAGAINRKGLRPYLSLRRPRIGFRRSSAAAAQEDMRPILRAVAAASPFVIAKTIGARVGTTMVTPVIIRPVAMHSAFPSASFSLDFLLSMVSFSAVTDLAPAPSRMPTGSQSVTSLLSAMACWGLGVQLQPLEIR